MSLMFLFLMVPASGAIAEKSYGEQGSAVIFMYHRFGDPRFPSTNVRMDQFRAQVSYLEEHGFRIVPVEEVLTALKNGEGLPPKTVALTMDDAYGSVYENAWPLLKEKGWPFTVFVSTDAVDAGLRDYMSWDQIIEMSRHGVQFANHTASHPHMIDRAPGETEEQWLKRLKADVEKARKRLDEMVGTTPLLFAYPYGEYTAKVAELVSGLGYLAFAQHSGAAGPGSDLKAIPRFPMSEVYAEMPAFKIKATARALPVVEMIPWDPLTTEKRPELEVLLGPTDALLDELSCYVSGQGRVDVEWVVPGRRFRVRAARDLSPGRHKYNITVPGKDRREYHWFSRQWIVRD